MSYGTQAMADRYINAAKDGYLDVLGQATKRDLNTGDEDGMTAVMWAAHNGHLDALRLVVGRGGDVDRCDYLGLTPLHHAAQRGHLHIITFLANWDANVFALDNDHHSALDLASLYEKVEVVQFLDSVYAQQKAKNPKYAAKQQGAALKQAESNLKRYEKLKEEAAKRAEKQQKRLSSNNSHTTGGNNGSGGGGQTGGGGTVKKQNLFKTLTLALRGSKSNRKMQPAGLHYSDIAGLGAGTGARGGVAKRINQRRNTDYSSGTVGAADGGDFKISDMDESGRRTLRSLSGAQGVRSKTSEVLYMTGQRGGGGGGGGGSDTATSADMGSSSRPAVMDVFGAQRPVFKSKSESDLLDSGVDSYLGDEDDDDENAPGIFNRPGFGKTAFFTGSNFLNTLQSFDGGQQPSNGSAQHPEDDDDDETLTSSAGINGFGGHVMNGELGGGGGDALSDVLDGNSSWRGPKELPWDQEEVDRLDDDDEATTSSALETFLFSVGLESYLHKFLQEKVDMEVLVTMSDGDLKEIGLPFGPRKKLLEAIKLRHQVLALPKHMTDSFL